jgi:hypothetical protein
VLLLKVGFHLLHSSTGLLIASLCDRANFRVSGNVNGVNVIGLALQGPSVPGLQLIQGGAGRSPATIDMGYTYQHPLQARGPTREYATNKGKSC